MSNNKIKPIMVTGSHRSGTTWVGRMLCNSPALYYIHEPFNPAFPPGLGICNAHVKTWFKYISKENEKPYVQPFQEMLAGKYSLLRDLKKVRSKSDLEKILKRSRKMRNYQKENRTPLIKDPIAVFSASWIYERFDCNIVVMIRHPAAFVNSLRNLNWKFDFKFILEQPLLLRDVLPDYVGLLQMEQKKLERGGFSFIEHGALLWKLIHCAILSYQDTYKNWLFLRHEDLSYDPITEFRKLYNALGLSWTSEIEALIVKSCMLTNVSEQKFNIIKRNSASEIGKYKQNLSEKEIGRIKDITYDIAKHFYPE